MTVIVRQNDGTSFAVYDVRAGRYARSDRGATRSWRSSGGRCVNCPVEMGPVLARVTDRGAIVISARYGAVLRTALDAATAAHEVMTLESVLDMQVNADRMDRSPGHPGSWALCGSRRLQRCRRDRDGAHVQGYSRGQPHRRLATSRSRRAALYHQTTRAGGHRSRAP